MSKKAIGQLEDRLKEYRYRRDWTQAQLALAVNLGFRTIQRVEAGEPVGERTVYLLEQFLKRQEAAA